MWGAYLIIRKIREFYKNQAYKIILINLKVMKMNDDFNIGNRIHELRTAQGQSQEQLALHSGITTTYLGLIERNIKNPTIKVIEQLCLSLNISLSDFFNVSQEVSYSVDSLTVQIVSLLRGRTDEEKKIILQIIKNTLKLRDLPNPSCQENSNT